jgi:hypothetical protein
MIKAGMSYSLCLGYGGALPPRLNQGRLFRDQGAELGVLKRRRRTNSLSGVLGK